jgi:hypothetical protein
MEVCSSWRRSIRYSARRAANHSSVRNWSVDFGSVWPALRVMRCIQRRVCRTLSQYSEWLSVRSMVMRIRCCLVCRTKFLSRVDTGIIGHAKSETCSVRSPLVAITNVRSTVIKPACAVHGNSLAVNVTKVVATCPRLGTALFLALRDQRCFSRYETSNLP